jgi:2-methylcitrate dehydratase PrpD
MFGNMAKPFHAGRAADKRAGRTPCGARIHCQSWRARGGAGLRRDPERQRASVDVPLPRAGSLVVETLFKYNAACYLTHSSIEAIKLLRRQLSFSGPDVASIDIHVAPGHLSVCNIASPRSGLETKFSLRHTAALAACGKDTAAIQTYSDENALDATLAMVRETHDRARRSRCRPRCPRHDQD